MGADLLKTSRIIDLFEIYGDLLAEKQKNYIKSYYLYDLSLSEIAEENGISRASVLDTLNQANKKLEEYENTLHLLVKREKIKEILNSKLKKEEILKELEGIL
jgi:predicted DNA-binding protein YlxM (UPF0122 family)